MLHYLTFSSLANTTCTAHSNNTRKRVLNYEKKDRKLMIAKSIEYLFIDLVCIAFNPNIGLFGQFDNFNSIFTFFFLCFFVVFFVSVLYLHTILDRQASFSLLYLFQEMI